MKKGSVALMVILIVIAIVSLIVMTVTLKKSAEIKRELAEAESNIEVTLLEKNGLIDDLSQKLEVSLSSKANTEKELVEVLETLNKLQLKHDEIQKDFDNYKEKFGYEATIKFTLDRYNLTAEQVEFSLLSTPQVIGQEPVLGGTMFFTKARMLSPKWVIGYFEDGHILGYGIYTYKVTETGFVWEELLSAIDDGTLDAK